MPDYDVVVDRLLSLDDRFDVTVTAEIASFPVYSARRQSPSPSGRFWINAGTHGDEPAGVEAALAFLESDLPDHFPNTDLLVMPCLNPFGYSRDQRENAGGVDINWAFDRDDIEEIRVIKDVIDGVRFDAILDLHEDWESPGYYLYEQFGSRRSLGQTITSRVASACPVNEASQIEGERAEQGVIFPDMTVPRRASGAGVPVEVFRQAACHQITSESPTSRTMTERVRAHMIAIEVFLEAYGVG